MAFTVGDRQEYLLGRERLPQNEAAVFVETRLAAQSPFVRNEGLDRIVTIEEDQRLTQISADLWKQAEAEKTQIFDLIAKVQAKMQKKAGKGSPALASDARNATWPQVLEQVAVTAQQWSESRKTSNISVFIDRIGRNSESFQTWLQVLPNGDYGSSICGVFSIAISAAGHYYKAEDAIFEGLAEIPEILDNAKRYVKIYSETRYSNLERKTFDLYLSILRALKHILKFFADNSARRFYEPVIKQSSYQQDLRASLDDIRKQAERIKEEAIQCSHERLGNIEGDLLKYGDLIHQVKDDTSQHGAVLSQQGTVLQAIYRLLQSAVGENKMSASGPGNQAIQPAPTLGGALPEAPPSYEQARRLLRLLQPNTDGAGDKDGDDVACKFLDETESDADACLNRAGMMTVRGWSKAAVLIQMKEFRTFMDMGETTGSDYLLVNGREGDEEHGPSPLTFIGAKLYQLGRSFGPKGPFILGYFCDEHRAFSDQGSERCKPVGIMLSLVGQLASQMVARDVSIDLSALEDKHWKKIKKRKFKTLGNVFHSLTRQLPQGSTLYCIIDEVTTYELTGMIEDLETILSRLIRTLGGCQQRGEVEFKLLVLARRESRRIGLGVGSMFEDHTINLPPTVEPMDSAQTVMENMGKVGESEGAKIR